MLPVNRPPGSDLQRAGAHGRDAQGDHRYAWAKQGQAARDSRYLECLDDLDRASRRDDRP